MFNRPTILALLLLAVAAIACTGQGSPTSIPPQATVTPTEAAMRKVTPALINQIELRQQQIKQPTAQRLDQMQSMGMNVTILNIQRVFIHMTDLPNVAQVQDMRSLGLAVYMDSWIPPSGNSPTGFLLAEMPVGVLTDLASRDYVVKLETAERLSQPQGLSKNLK